MSGSVGASDDKRGSTKGGSLLLAEIDQHRLFGRYASLRAASHTLPSSSVAQAQSLRNLILGECELEQYVLQEQEQAALRSAIAQSGSPDQDQASSSHVHLLANDCSLQPLSSVQDTLLQRLQDESTPDGQRRSVSRKHSRSSSMSGSGSASSAKEKHCLQVAGRYFKDVIATNKNENDVVEARLFLARTYLLSDRYQDAEALYTKHQPSAEDTAQMPLRRALLVAHSYACRAAVAEGSNAAALQQEGYEIFLSALLRARDQRSLKGEALELTTSISDIAHVSLQHIRRLAEIGAGSDAISACRQLLALGTAIPFELRTEVLLLLANIHLDHPETPFQQPAAPVISRRTSRVGGGPPDPKTAEEDAILALIIAEAQLLARSSRALENADIFVRLYDCIMLLLNICGLHDQAVEVLERAIAATYGADNFHLWMLLGAELERTDRHKHAIAVYHQCALDHTTTHPARVCEALTAAAKASLFLGTQRASQDAIQADLRKARTASTTQQQRHATDQLAAATHLLEYRSLHDAAQQAAALKAAKTALSSIDDDLKTADDMYLEALTLAHARATDDAVGAVWSCLSLCPTHRQGLQLFALLLTAKRNLDEALSVCHQTLELFPTDVVSMRIAGHTTHALEGPRGALSAYKTFFASMNTMMRDAMKAGRPFQPLGPSSIGADTLTGEFLNIDDAESAISIQSGHASAISVTASNASGGDSGLRLAVDGSSMTAASIFTEMWLDSAEWFLSLEQSDDADKCVQQARQLAGPTPAVDRFLGRRARREGRVRDAIEHLEQALTFDEHDVTSLVELGMCQHSLGEADMAENRLQHALRIDPTHAEAHRALATLLQERGATDDAVQCMLHALQLGAHQPILPYHTLTCCPFLT